MVFWNFVAGTLSMLHKKFLATSGDISLKICNPNLNLSWSIPQIRFKNSMNFLTKCGSVFPNRTECLFSLLPSPQYKPKPMPNNFASPNVDGLQTLNGSPLGLHFV